MLGADDDQGGLVQPDFFQFGDELAEGLVDEVELARESWARCTQDVRITTLQARDRIHRQLLSNTDRLEVGSKQRRHAYFLRVIVVVAVDLIEHRLNMQRVVTLDVVEAVRPAVVERRVLEGHDGAAGDLRQRHRDGIDFRTVEILDPFAAGSIGPLIRRVLIGPCCAAAMRLHDLEYGVHPQVLMWQERVAAVLRIAHQKCRIQAPAPVEPGQVDIYGFIPRDIRADLARAGTAWIAQSVGLCRR